MHATASLSFLERFGPGGNARWRVGLWFVATVDVHPVWIPQRWPELEIRPAELRMAGRPRPFPREDFRLWGGCRWYVWHRQFPESDDVRDRPGFEHTWMQIVAQVDAAFWYTLKRLGEDGWETFQAHGTDGCGYDLRKRLPPRPPGQR